MPKKDKNEKKSEKKPAKVVNRSTKKDLESIERKRSKELV